MCHPPSSSSRESHSIDENPEADREFERDIGNGNVEPDADASMRWLLILVHIAKACPGFGQNHSRGRRHCSRVFAAYLRQSESITAFIRLRTSPALVFSTAIRVPARCPSSRLRVAAPRELRHSVPALQADLP